jgi:hypothetical protein
MSTRINPRRDERHVQRHPHREQMYFRSVRTERWGQFVIER